MPSKKHCPPFLAAAVAMGCACFATAAEAQGAEPADKMDAFSQNMGKIVGVAVIVVLIVYAIKTVVGKGKKKDAGTDKAPEDKQ